MAVKFDPILGKVRQADNDTTVLYLNDANGVKWKITIATDGTLQTVLSDQDSLLLEVGDDMLLESGSLFLKEFNLIQYLRLE